MIKNVCVNYKYSIVIIIITTMSSMAAYADSDFSCNDYGKKHESVGYATVRNITYDTNEPLFLTFCWIVDDEIYVGKLITIYAEIEKPYYNYTDYNSIKIIFPEELINYWNPYSNNIAFEYTNGPYYENISKMYKKNLDGNILLNRTKYKFSNELVLYPNINNTFFKSEPINLRFIVPEIININYCDHMLAKECINITNIMKPAAYDLGERIKTNNYIKMNSEKLLAIGQATIILTVIMMVLTGITIYRTREGSIEKLVRKLYIKKSSYELKIPIRKENIFTDTEDFSYLINKTRKIQSTILSIIFTMLTIALTYILYEITIVSKFFN